MLEAIREGATLVDGIARATQEQSSAISEVSTAIRQMDEMTQHNAALVEETNAAIEQTETQASDLDRIVDVFEVGDSDVQSKRAGTPEAIVPSVGGKARGANLQPSAMSYLVDGNAAIKEGWSEF